MKANEKTIPTNKGTNHQLNIKSLIPINSESGLASSAFDILHPELILGVDIIKSSNRYSLENKKEKCIDLDYLHHCTKSKPAVIAEFISIYLEQTPFLIGIMKGSLVHKDWHAMQVAAHKLIPSFYMMGINIEFENMAKQIQKYAGNELQTDEIPELVLQLENICTQACIELEEEVRIIKNQLIAKALTENMPPNSNQIHSFLGGQPTTVKLFAN